jgi:chromosome segregation ATPase
MKDPAVTTDNQIAAPSFDRMRNMLVRAAEVRESEQQQIFDALDDIYARLAPVDSLGAVRKRLSEMPDSAVTTALSERLDEALSRLEAQDNAMAELARSVDGLVDKLAKPFAQLEGRLEVVGTRFDGVAARMEGLEDKLQNIHRRIDELGSHLDRQDTRLEAMPTVIHGLVRERIESSEAALRTHIDAKENALTNRVEQLDRAIDERVAASTEALTTSFGETAEMIDPAEKLENLGGRVEEVTGKLDDLNTRLNKVEENFIAQLGDVEGMLKSGFSKADGVMTQRPDTTVLTSVVRKSAEESVNRIGGQLDEAMATFAELMLGGGPAQQSQMMIAAPPPAPRQPRRATARNNGRSPKPSDVVKAKAGGDDED